MKTKRQKTTVATVEAAEVGAIEIKVEPQTEGEQAAAPVQVEVTTTPAPKAKASGKSKKAAAKSAKDDRETQDKTADENAVKMPEPLAVDEQKLSLKVQAMRQKLEAEKRETTKSPVHVSYGYFLARAKSGKVLVLEYHEALKPNKWIARDLETKEILGEPAKTMHGLHETAVKNF